MLSYYQLERSISLKYLKKIAMLCSVVFTVQKKYVASFEILTMHSPMK